MKIEELVDRKVLYINYPINKNIVHEGKINEISPSKKCIKINHEWFILDNIRIIELFTEEDRPSMRFT